MKVRMKRAITTATTICPLHLASRLRFGFGASTGFWCIHHSVEITEAATATREIVTAAQG